VPVSAMQAHQSRWALPALAGSHVGVLGHTQREALLLRLRHGADPAAHQRRVMAAEVHPVRRGMLIQVQPGHGTSGRVGDSSAPGLHGLLDLYSPLPVGQQQEVVVAGRTEAEAIDRWADHLDQIELRLVVHVHRP